MKKIKSTNFMGILCTTNVNFPEYDNPIYMQIKYTEKESA